MLVLSRKIMESVHFYIPDGVGGKREVKVQVVRIGDKIVRLGIEAEKDVTILREELVNKEK